MIAACTRAPGSNLPARATPLDGAQQLVVGVTAGWDDTAVTLARFERVGHAWQAVGAPWAGVLGRSGSAWGRGLHGAGAPPGASGPTKQEGDGRSPAGAFEILASYGYAAAAPAGARMSYASLGDGWRCVDDAASAHYNRVLDATGLAIDWKSAEVMHRPDELYTWVIEIGHNHEATPGGGSCIFFHVWSGPASSTSGCTAMPQPAIEAMLGWLDPARHPIYVLLPRGEYARIAPTWGLPPAPGG